MNAPQKPYSWIEQYVGDRHRYRINSRLGGGGMGDVFLATDTLLGQQVAIKMLKDKLVEETEIRQRFEREALLCAAIQCEHVVQVKDYGITAEGFPFFVMEYLQGQTLGQLLQRERRLSVERTVRIISQVCEGLFKAHSGVIMSHESAKNSEKIQLVHRDLKPENIFLVNTSLGELVKILDFGIAKVFCIDVQSTSTGLFMGTFQYAAPEQIESRKDIDLRADIYSLGMILYEMLCGTDPFGCLDEGRGGANWLRSHIAEPPRSLRSQPHCADLPIALESVVMKCLSKSPLQRFESVAALYQALQEATDVKVEAMAIMRSIAASAQTSISSSDSRPAKQVAQDSDLNSRNKPSSNSAQPKRSAQLDDENTSQIKQKLEMVLLRYVGPIAKILVKQSQINNLTSADVIDSLSQHVPPSQRAEFKMKAQSEISAVVHKFDPTINSKSKAIDAIELAPSSPTTKLIPINPKFVDQCQQELAEIIGPMAKIVLQKALAQSPSQSQLVEAIAKQIPNHAEKFRQRFQH